MNNKEYTLLNGISKINDLISVEDLSNIKDRTLLYGYTCNRDTFHVYLKNGNIHTVMYNTKYNDSIKYPVNMMELDVKSNYDYIPNKRLYPETCDYEFCKLLKKRDVHLPFTNFNNERKKEDFYGFTLDNN